MDRWPAVVLAALLVVAGVPAPAGAAGSGELNQIPGSSLGADSISMRADLAEDGTANWSVAYRVRLDDENVTAAFEDLQADIEANESAYVGSFQQGIEATVAAAQNRTGREMNATDFRVSTEIEQVPREYGVVTYRFEWSGFAVPEDARLRAGDALAGLFLDSATRLTVSGPPGDAVLSVSPREPAEVRENAVVWSGPIDFAPGEPTLVFGPPPTTADTGTSPDSGMFLPLVAAALVAALVAAAVAVWFSRRSGGSLGSGDEPDAGAGTTESRDGAESTPEAEEPEDQPAPDEDLLSNEERVERLLERRGGRVKQQEIVSELDWTEAKTSQVVNAMQDEGRLEKFRIGRENVVKLPDTEDESE